MHGARLVVERNSFQNRFELGVIERFGEKIVGPLLHGFDGHFNRSMSGHQDHRSVGSALLENLQQIEAGQFRHHNVRKNDVGLKRANEILGFYASVGQIYFISPLFQADPKDFKHCLFIIDNQDFRAHGDVLLYMHLNACRLLSEV